MIPASSGQTPTPTNEVAQAQHYDSLIGQYDAHISDPSTKRYRRTFIDAKLTAGLDLEQARVLEAMCGSGHSVPYLWERGAHVTGLDISEKAMGGFAEQWSPKADAVTGSLLETPFEMQSFDCVLVVGGLHHLHPNLDAGITEIARILKPGGSFCFYEPHSTSLADRARRLWYRHDSLFVGGEGAIEVSDLMARHAHHFEVVSTRFVGSVAYLTVLNSMILRIPVGFKRFYAAAAMRTEALLDRCNSELFSCAVVAQWRRRDMQ